MKNSVVEESLRPWGSLDVAEQVELRVEYGYYLDRLPPSCSMETKVERFRRWLAVHKGINYE